MTVDGVSVRDRGCVAPLMAAYRCQKVITLLMTATDRDPGLDTLLDLHGQTLFVDEVGHWVKFVVVRTETSVERPHGLSYSLTLHAPDGTRLVGFDNAHPVRERQGTGTRRRRRSDHRHRLLSIGPYG